MGKDPQGGSAYHRNARARLPTGLHFKGIDPDVHLGYRKGRRGGVWLVRWRNGIGYWQAPLGTADDELHKGTLDYEAVRRAARVAVDAARAEAMAKADGPPITVRLAVETYVAERDARDSKRVGREKRSDAAQRLGRYLLGQGARGHQEAIRGAALADVALYTLKDDDLKAWRDGLPETMKATAKQRLVNDLKAALNAACAANRKKLPPTLPGEIKNGLKAVNGGDENEPLARDNQILTDLQIGRLLHAVQEIDVEQGWEDDLFRLVIVMASTGARFSQAARLKVGDVQRTHGRLMVPVSRKGRGTKNGSMAVPVGMDILNALRPVTTGRAGDAPLLERWRHRQVAGGIRWERAGRGPWQSSSEMVRPWHEIRERAKMPEVIPYALRHSSIVRGIRANLPIRLVAALA